MPLTRYQIRNEYSLADPELFRAADKDDPEALLEGVAMAGLVGVLRQLGDLAEFAAEIFHDLHEEVMATAARGHGLMVRVQQLEAEFPSIEKAFLSKTSHSLFFYNAGGEWHPNLRTDQNLIARGDLPRFVMDSYEECRGPPRLFLLDKFDVAGAGACLKRYTDPSFFKVEAASSGRAKVDIQRDKKIRKVKKKGTRWRNGETPEVLPTSHAKLHQLFLEERVENGSHDPARLVKLKKRQLNGFPFDSQTKKSYMEKFLQTPSPDNKVVHEIPFRPPPLKLTSNGTSELGLEIVDIRTVSPIEESLQRKRSTSLSPIAQETVLKPSIVELSEEVIDEGLLILPAPNSEGDGEIDEIPSVVHKVVDEKELAVDGEIKTDGSVDESPSDDIASETDNYMDALTTMESEMETDTECKPKNNLRFLNIRKNGTDSDANEEQQEVQAQFSDSQSNGNSNASEDENMLFKKGRSSFSYSDTVSNLADNTPSDGDGTGKTESCVAEIVDTSSDQRSINEEIVETKSHEPLVPNGSCIEVAEIPSYSSEFGEASCNSCLTDSNPLLLPLDPGARFREALMVGPELDETSSDSVKLGTGLSDTDKNRTNLGDYLPTTAIVTDGPSQTRDDSLLSKSAEIHPADELNGGNPSVFSDVSLHPSNNSVLAPERNSSDDSVNKGLQTEYADDGSSEDLVIGNIASPHSIISSTEEQLPSSTLPELEPCSSITLLLDSLPASIACYPDVGKPDDILSKVDDAIPAAGVNSGNLTPMVDNPLTPSFSEQFSERTDDAPVLELDSAEVGVMYSGEETDLERVYSTIDSEEIAESTSNGDRVGSGDVPLQFSSDYPSHPGPRDNVHLDDIVTGIVKAETVAVDAAGSDDGNDVICLTPDRICSPSRSSINMQEPPSTCGESHQKGLEIHGSSPPHDLTESDVQKEVNRLAIAPREVDSSMCGTVSYTHSNSSPDSSLDEQTQNSLPIGDVTTAPTSPKQNDQDMGSKSPHQTHLSENSEDAVSSSKPGIPLKQALELQGDHLNVENLHANEASHKLSNLQFEQTLAPNHLDQERDFDASESSLDDLPSQPSVSEFSLQSAGLKFESSDQAMDPLESSFPGFGVLPKASRVNLEEMPPLPPLPPMQWRIGKFQHAPLDSGKELVGHTPASFPPILPSSADEKAYFGFPALGGEIQEPQNPFLPLSAIKDDQSRQVSEYLVGNSVQPSPFLLQMPTMVNDAYSQCNVFTLEGTQSMNPFLTLPATSEEKPQRGFHAMEGESIQPSLNPISPIPTIEYTTFRHAPVLMSENLIQPLNQLAPETGLDDKKPRYTSQNSGELVNHPEAFVSPPTKEDERPRPGLLRPDGSQNSGEKVNYPEAFVPPPTNEDEHPQHGLLGPEGKTALSSNASDLLSVFEDGKSNGNPSVKLPRPRSPLVDAVAAHDKSKMRKVTERVRPQIGPQVDERDSLLEQIRTKSFNLKPAVATRPSIQGPKTNLKVSAILEKANAIRQALAGSDEDDDADSWSDS